MGRELCRLFVEAGMPEVELPSHALSLTAASRQELFAYVASAREMIAQMREAALVAADIIDRAEAEYGALADQPHAFCVEVMCCASARALWGDRGAGPHRDLARALAGKPAGVTPLDAPRL